MQINNSFADRLSPAPVTELHLSTPAPNVSDHGLGRCDHLVQFYESDDVLMDSVASFVGEALRADGNAVVIGTRDHRSGVERRLLDSGIDLVDVVRRGRYISEDADDVMAGFMVNRMPDRKLFTSAMSEILTPLVSQDFQTHIFGEMVALLVDAGNYAAAIALEELWNELQETLSFSLLCAYPMNHGGGQTITELFGSVIAAHTHIVPAESFSALSSQDDQLRAIALLQQKALWLEREIVERKHAEERLKFALASEQEARQETEDALSMRDEFLSIAAHELKTPLTGLNGHVQLALRMLDRNDDPTAGDRVRRSLGVIGDQSQKLSRLLDQLLDTSRIETGRLAIEPRPTDLAALVQQVAETARIAANRQSIIVTTPRTLTVDVDPLRLEQVLSNLLDNAIRHSPNRGRIDITLACPEPGTIELSVRDHGPGIPAEHRERVFDRYYRLQGNGTVSGMGLGLHICREIVELHGGSIRAESPSDGGTRFIVQLPAE